MFIIMTPLYNILDPPLYPVNKMVTTSNQLPHNGHTPKCTFQYSALYCHNQTIQLIACSVPFWVYELLQNCSLYVSMQWCCECTSSALPVFQPVATDGTCCVHIRSLPLSVKYREKIRITLALFTQSWCQWISCNFVSTKINFWKVVSGTILNILIYYYTISFSKIKFVLFVGCAKIFS